MTTPRIRILSFWLFALLCALALVACGKGPIVTFIADGDTEIVPEAEREATEGEAEAEAEAGCLPPDWRCDETNGIRLEILPNLLEFGRIDVGLTRTQSFTVRSVLPSLCVYTPEAAVCKRAVHLWDFAITGADATQFLIESAVPKGNETPLTLLPNETLTVKVLYSCTRMNDESHPRDTAVLSFMHDTRSNGDSTSVALRGGSVRAELCASPDTIYFGDIPLETACKTSLMLDNCGFAPLVITSVGWAPGETALTDCTITPSESFRLEVMQSVTLEVACTPVTTGYKVSAIEVGWGSGRLLIPVSYTVTLCEPTLYPSETLNFGAVPWGTSLVQTLHITNPCAVNGRITNISIAQDGDAFSLSHKPSFPLSFDMHTTQEVAVMFKAPDVPVPNALYTARLTVDFDDWGQQSKTITLSARPDFMADGDSD